MPTGIYKRTKPVSKETRLKLRLSRLGKPANSKGKHWVSKLSDEERNRRREVMKIIGKGQGLKPDEKHYRWKGDKVGYYALHHWINKKLGHPFVCEHCGKSEGRLEWANVDHKYRRSLEDWIRLCKKCHYKYDKEFNARILS